MAERTFFDQPGRLDGLSDGPTSNSNEESADPTATCGYDERPTHGPAFIERNRIDAGLKLLSLPYREGSEPMNETHSRAIVYLLAAILCVMLFGASAFMTGLAWGGAVAAAVGLAFAAIVGVVRLVRSLRHETIMARDAGEPWMLLPILWIGIAGNFVVMAWAMLIWLNQGGYFRDAIDQVPYWWVPLSIMAASVVIGLAEGARTWGPKLPGRIAAFFRGWFLLFCAPVFGPIGRWREIRSARARGERVNLVGTALSVMGTFLAACLLWFGGVLLPAVLVAVLIFESSR